MKYSFSKDSTNLIITLDTESGKYAPEVTSLNDPNITLENGSFWIYENGKFLRFLSFDQISTIDGVIPSNVDDAFTKLNTIINTLHLLASPKFKGTAVPTDTPTGIEDAFWIASQAGTYTNFGGVVVSANSRAEISRVSGVFTISQTPLDITSKVNVSDIVNTLVSSETAKPLSAAQGKALNEKIAKGIVAWTAIAFASGDQVNHLGKDWVSNAAIVAGDVPGTSTKWLERLSGYSGVEISNRLESVSKLVLINSKIKYIKSTSDINITKSFTGFSIISKTDNTTTTTRVFAKATYTGTSNVLQIYSNIANQIILQYWNGTILTSISFSLLTDLNQLSIKQDGTKLYFYINNLEVFSFAHNYTFSLLNIPSTYQSMDIFGFSLFNTDFDVVKLFNNGNTFSSNEANNSIALYYPKTLKTGTWHDVYGSDISIANTVYSYDLPTVNNYDSIKVSANKQIAIGKINDFETTIGIERMAYSATYLMFQCYFNTSDRFSISFDFLNNYLILSSSISGVILTQNINLKSDTLKINGILSGTDYTVNINDTTVSFAGIILGNTGFITLYAGMKYGSLIVNNNNILPLKETIIPYINNYTTIVDTVLPTYNALTVSDSTRVMYNIGSGAEKTVLLKGVDLTLAGKLFSSDWDGGKEFTAYVSAGAITIQVPTAAGHATATITPTSLVCDYILLSFSASKVSISADGISKTVLSTNSVMPSGKNLFLTATALKPYTVQGIKISGSYLDGFDYSINKNIPNLLFNSYLKGSTPFLYDEVNEKLLYTNCLFAKTTASVHLLNKNSVNFSGVSTYFSNTVNTANDFSIFGAFTSEKHATLNKLFMMLDGVLNGYQYTNTFLVQFDITNNLGVVKTINTLTEDGKVCSYFISYKSSSNRLVIVVNNTVILDDYIVLAAASKTLYTSTISASRAPINYYYFGFNTIFDPSRINRLTDIYIFDILNKKFNGNMVGSPLFVDSLKELNTYDKGFTYGYPSTTPTKAGESLLDLISGKNYVSVVSTYGNSFWTANSNKTRVLPKDSIYGVAPTKALVTLSDDDSFSQVWTIIKPLCETYGVNFSIAAIADKINKDGRLTSAQLFYLQNKLGFEICSHSLTHASMTTIDEKYYEDEIVLSKSILESMDLQIDGICWPFGNWTKKALEITKKHYSYATNFRPSIANTYSTFDNYQVQRIGILAYGGAYKTYDSIKAVIDTAIANKTYINLVTHVGSAGQAETDNWSPAYTAILEQVIQYLVSKQTSGDLEIVTQREGLRKFGNIIQNESRGAMKADFSQITMFPLPLNGSI